MQLNFDNSAKYFIVIADMFQIVWLCIWPKLEKFEIYEVSNFWINWRHRINFRKTSPLTLRRNFNVNILLIWKTKRLARKKSMGSEAVLRLTKRNNTENNTMIASALPSWFKKWVSPFFIGNEFFIYCWIRHNREICLCKN